MYTQTPKIAYRAFNREVFPRTNSSPSESHFFHTFQTGRFLICLELPVKGKPAGCPKFAAFSTPETGHLPPSCNSFPWFHLTIYSVSCRTYTIASINVPRGTYRTFADHASPPRKNARRNPSRTTFGTTTPYPAAWAQRLKDSVQSCPIAASRTPP